MANQEHFEILRQGWDAWDQLRVKNPGLRPDLSGVDLSQASLVGAKFMLTNLTGANLAGAKLGAGNFLGATLAEANLSQADLTAAVFSWANLTGANLTGAKLAGANLSVATLTGANLTGANLFFTVFGHTDLTNALGLDTCDHSGPSILDHATLECSGQLPMSFLRGCGLPETLINYLPAILNQAIQYNSCFISYSTEDHDFATRLYADLQNKGVRCWFAPHNVQGGKYLHEQIDGAIELYDRLLLILSETSIHSEWVKTEIAKARKRELRENRRMLFPVRLMDFETLQEWKCFDADIGKDSAREIREYYVPDFSSWTNPKFYKVEFEKLLRDLKPEAHPPSQQ